MKEKETNQQEKDNIWKITLVLVCSAILVYGFFYSKNLTTDLVICMAYNMLSTLFIWVFFYVAVARKRGAKIAGFSFLAIYISMIAIDLIGGYYPQQKQVIKKMLSEIQGQYSELIEPSTDAQRLPKRIEKPINTTPIIHGEWGEIERFMKELMDQIVSQRNDYLLELKAIGWNSILDANRIKADNTFVESTVTIQKAKEVVKKYTKRTQTLMINAKVSMRSLNVSESLKRSMLFGFDRGLKKTKENIEAIWSLEAKTINEVEKIVTLLSEKKGAWVLDGDQILFYNDSDLERFNIYIASIQNMAQQQEAIKRQATQAVQTINRILEMK